MFEKILAALDGSEHSAHALEIAIRMAKEHHSKLTLIHVYSVSVMPVVIPEPVALTPPSIPVMTPIEMSKVAEAAQKAGSKILDEAEQKAETLGVEVQKTIVEGQAAHEILKTAKEGSFELIIIGARGLSKIKEILLGSVSDAVARNAPCPVLIVK